MRAGLTDSFKRQDEDAIERAAGDIYVIANNTDESANTSTPDPSLAGRMATEADNTRTRHERRRKERQARKAFGLHQAMHLGSELYQRTGIYMEPT